MKPLLLVALLCATAAWGQNIVEVKVWYADTHDTMWVASQPVIDSLVQVFIDRDGWGDKLRYTPAEKLAALHVWRHCTGYGMKWEYFVWPNNNPIYVWYSCPDIACQWREVRP